MKPWAWGALLVMAVGIAYSPALRCGFIWDDEQHVTKPGLRTVEGLQRIWTQPGVVNQYYPLVHSGFWVEHKLWGDRPLGYHLVNILLHALAALLLWRVLRQLDVPGAWLGAALFALHPVQVESVAWISEMKNTLSGVFYLAVALTYLRYDRSRNLGAYVAAFILFVAGLLSKTVIATLPAAMLVVFWWKRGSLKWKNDVRPLVPFFLAGTMSGLLTAWAERQFYGAEGLEFHLSLLQRFLIAGRAFWFYLGKLVWPANLIFIYPRWDDRQLVGWYYVFAFAAPLLLLILSRLRGRSRAPLAVGLLFAGTLFPALGFFNIFLFRYSFVADHFQYLACIAPLAFAAAFLVRYVRLSAVLLIGLGVLTWRQCPMYADNATLWRSTLARNPGCWMAHLNTGVLLAAQGRFGDAIAHYEAASKTCVNCAEVFYNWGNALVAIDQPDTAANLYRRALENDPHLAAAEYNWANLLAAQGRIADAIARYRRALEVQPAFADAHVNWGLLLAAQGQSAAAIEHYRQALRLNPNLPVAHFNLANELSARQDPAAVDHYLAAVRLRPEYAEAFFNLGIALAARDQFADGLRCVEQANRLTGESNALMLAGLANLYAHAGRLTDAKHIAEHAFAIAVTQSNAALTQALRIDLQRYSSVTAP